MSHTFLRTSFFGVGSCGRSACLRQGFKAACRAASQKPKCHSVWVLSWSVHIPLALSVGSVLFLLQKSSAAVCVDL